MQLMTAIWWRDEWSHFRANMLLAGLLERLAEHYRPEPKARGAPRGEGWMARVHRLVRDRLSTIRTTADLASAVGLSRDYFARRFKAATGETPAAFLRRQRLNEAAMMVRSTTWSIEAIARHAGYRSAACLDQAWARRYPVPPLRWRRENT
jgi:transcriptional regulator GlxA family with amidase domain